MSKQKTILLEFFTKNNVKHTVFDNGKSLMLPEIGLVLPLDGDIVVSPDEWMRLCMLIGEKRIIPLLKDISSLYDDGKVISYDFKKGELL